MDALDAALHDQVPQGLLQALHAELRPRLDAGGHLMGLGLADQVPDGHRRHHDLQRGDPALLVRGREQELGDDPLQDSASWTRTCCCCPGGKASMIRSTVLRALLVCRVPKTRRPVSAAVRASEIGSRSRISPTRTMSESSRRAARRPSAKDGVWRPPRAG